MVGRYDLPDRLPFFCLGPGRAKVIFAEEVAGLTSAPARRSLGFTGVLQTIELTADARAGAQLSRQLAAGLSRMTLIRLIRRWGASIVTGPCWWTLMTAAGGQLGRLAPAAKARGAPDAVRIIGRVRRNLAGQSGRAPPVRSNPPA